MDYSEVLSVIIMRIMQWDDCKGSAQATRPHVTHCEYVLCDIEKLKHWQKTERQSLAGRNMAFLFQFLSEYFRIRKPTILQMWWWYTFRLWLFMLQHPLIICCVRDSARCISNASKFACKWKKFPISNKRNLLEGYQRSKRIGRRVRQDALGGKRHLL